MYASPNRADNITPLEAAEFLGKLARLGFFIGPLHVNETVSGSQASYVPIGEVPAELAQERLNCVVFARGNWHNVAALKLFFGTGGIEGFRRVYDSIGGYGSAEGALLSVPGAAKAVEKAIEKA